MIFASPAERRRADELATWLEDGRAPAGHDLEPVVALVTTLRPAPSTPSAQFRARLRADLVTKATRSVPAPRAPAEPVTEEPPRRHRLRASIAVATTVILVAGAGAAAASTRALPGDPLYDLKRGIESVQLSLARSDASKGRELLEQADNRLTEAERLAAAEGARQPATRARIDEALAEMNAAVRDGADHLTDSYRDTGDPESLVLLDRFVVEQRERLGDLISLLDPALQDDAIGVLVLLNAVHADTATLAGTGTAASAALPPADESQLGPEGGDGWAAGMLSATPGEATSVVGTGTSTGTGAGPSSSTAGSPVDDVVGGVAGSLQDATGSASASSGSSSGTSEPVGGLPLPTGSSTSAPSPEPSLSVPTSVDVSVGTSGPGGEETGGGTGGGTGVEACVPLPPSAPC